MDSAVLEVNNKLAELENFLSINGGKDVTTFWNEDGTPDIKGAREYAEGIRENILGFSRVHVTQSVNKVTVCLA